MPKPDFEGYRNDIEKFYEEVQYPLSIDEHQVPDHPSTFIKMIRGGHNICKLQITRDVKFHLHLGLKNRPF
jgi:hypothetical protein